MTEQEVQAEYNRLLENLARVIDKQFNPYGKRTTGFALFIFPLGQGDDHRSNYISNANRKDTIAALKEFLVRAEEG